MQARATAADGEDAGALCGPFALGEDGALVAAHVLQRDLGGFRDVLRAATGAEHRLDLTRAQRRGVDGLDHVQRRPVRAHRGAQGLVDAQRVPLAIGVDQEHMFSVVMDPVEFELAHRRPLRRSLVAGVQTCCVCAEV